jgi:hypothetical protein
VADESAYNREVRSAVRWVLESIRRSLEKAYAAEYRRAGQNAAVIKQIMMALEAARISFNAITSEDGSLMLSRELRKIRENPRHATLLEDCRFQPLAGAKREFDERFTRLMSIGRAFTLLEELLLESVQSLPPGPLFETAPTLRQIVPDQKIAPVQFQISDNRLVISHRKSLSREADDANIEAAKAEVLRNGDKIISELLLSNCDRRLLASMQELQAQFQGEVDAIKIGLMNIGCEVMCNSYDAELPTAVASMLRAHTHSVQMFVGQFPEWARFVENAATADLDQADITSLRVASQTLVEAMKMQPELVNPEVPRTIIYLAEMLNSPTKAGKRAAFAMLRSLENLVSRVFGYGADFLEKTAEKSVDGASTAASKVVVGLLLLGLTGAVAIGPVSSKIPDMNWMKTATEIVKKQLDELTGK